MRASINGVIREAVIAACLTGLMILLFLGSWRSTLIIAVSIPLSILTSIIVLSFLHETINIMTLGGLALAVGILVDDATVEIENVNRNLDEGQGMRAGDSGRRLADRRSRPGFHALHLYCFPADVLSERRGALPVRAAGGSRGFRHAGLLRPFADAGADPCEIPVEVAASRPSSRNPFVLLQRAFEHGFDKLREGYQAILGVLVHLRILFVPCFLLALPVRAFSSIPGWARISFPRRTPANSNCTCAPRPARVSRRRRAFAIWWSNPFDARFPTINCSTSWTRSAYLIAASTPSTAIRRRSAPPMPTSWSRSTGEHRPTEEFVHALRASLPREFPGTEFYFLPDDIVSQILNFGLPAPIDVQIIGKNVEANRELADLLMNQMRRIPGIADLRIQQTFDQPKLHIFTDRTKAAESGYTQSDVAQSLLISLSGSFQTQPTFWLNPQNGVSYNVVTQAPQYDVQSLQALRNLPLTAGTQRHSGDFERCHLDQPRQRYGGSESLRHPAHHRHFRRGGWTAIWRASERKSTAL